MSPHGEGQQHARHPQRIGDFRILRVLGEGGMGVVYEAEQDHPRRRVALKVIRSTRMTADMQKRFEREAHVLGLLQHPGIAQIYQAGTADSGHGPEPYFAMELVQGRSLIEHARDEHLSLPQKLELLARVCDAVQHAHQKGVVHRDLKPGNILVVTEDATSSASGVHARSGSTVLIETARVGQPKVLDFGLARLTESDMPATTLQTEVGQLLGTVQYMSPEQVSEDSSRIDSRSDVYSLGVIGYELVARRLPYDLRGKAVLEALRVIREDAAHSISSIDRALRGDVETILSKALEKEPAQRYPTAADMAADIRRFLRDEPIVARPPSTVYQLRKFAARNKVLVGGIVAVFLALLAGLIGTALGFVEARKNEAIARDKGEEARAREVEAVRSRDDANAARDEATRLRDEATHSRDEATTARAAADASAAEAQAINDFLVKDILSAANPHVAKGRKITLEDVLENASTHADRAFTGQPLLAARLHLTLGDIENRIGRVTESERHFRATWTLRREKLGPLDDLTLDAQRALGRQLSEIGRTVEACDMLKEVVDAYRARHDDKLLVPSLAFFGQAQKLRGDVIAAQAAYDEALEILDGMGEEDSTTLQSLPALLADRASLYYSRGLYHDAQRDYERSLELYRRREGDVHPDVARIMGMIAVNSRSLGKLDQASEQVEEVLEMQRKLFTAEHPDIARTLSNSAQIAYSRGDYARAESRAREAIAMRSVLQGFDGYDLAPDRLTLADVFNAQGRFAEAATEAEKALEALEQDAGKRDEMIGEALFSLAIARRGKGDSAGAAQAGERSLEVMRNAKGSNPRKLVNSMSLVAQIHHARKEYDDAERLYREVLVLFRQLEGERSANVAIGEVNLGQFLLERGRLDEAEQRLRAGAEMAALVYAPDHPTLAAMRYSVGKGLHTLHKDADAIEALRSALDVQRVRLPAGGAATLYTLVLLGEILTETGAAAEAEPMLREVVDARRGPSSGKSAFFARAAEALGVCLVAQERFEDAESILLESHTTWAAVGTETEASSRTAQRLVALYEKLGRPEDARRWREPTAKSQ